ncbi:MAG: nuclear transport factor 2 family protein [Acidobacteriia bacterium]|nr:nuclear transport factor 2 family protein [Terriglobia bacterium]
MSKRQIMFGAAFLVLMLIWVGRCEAGDQSSKSAREAIQKLEQRWLDAENNPDVLEDILGDDFIHVFPYGFVTKEQQISYLRTHPLPDQGPKRFEELRVRIVGTVAIANGIVAANGADGKVSRTIFTDVFAYRNGKWQAVNAQENPVASPPRT